MVDQTNAAEFRLCPKEAREGILIAMVIAAALTGFMYWRSGSEGLLMGGGLSLVVVAGSVFQYFNAQRDRSIHVRIDGFGLHAPRMGANEPVAWAHISRIDFVRPRKQPLTMRVFLDDPSLAGPPAKGILGVMYRALQVAPINIPVDDLEGEPEDIVAAIRHFSPTTRVNA